jgi:hypothetical protein
MQGRSGRSGPPMRERIESAERYVHGSRSHGHAFETERAIRIRGRGALHIARVQIYFRALYRRTRRIFHHAFDTRSLSWSLLGRLREGRNRRREGEQTCH